MGKHWAPRIHLRVKSSWVLRQALVGLSFYALLCGKLLDQSHVSGPDQLELVGASGFEPPTSWSRTSLSKIPKPSSWRHLRDLEQQKIPLRFATIRNRQQQISSERRAPAEITECLRQ